MDRVLVALAAGILMIVMTSVIIVYDVWISDDKGLMEAETVLNEAAPQGELIFNDDTSIRNNSYRQLWIRARIVCDSSDSGDYTVISKSVGSGAWEAGKDGWYYYAEPVGFAVTTEPLVDRLLYKDEEGYADVSGRFSMQAEAVDEEWFVSRPANGSEAFRMFEEIMAIPERAYL